MRTNPTPQGAADGRYTGRLLVLLRGIHGSTAPGALRDAAGLRLAASSDFTTHGLPAALPPGEGVLFPSLGMAVVHAERDQGQALERCARAGRILIEREGYVRAAGVLQPLTASAPAAWGLHVTRAASSPYSGRGAKLAILDTGCDLEHPDFAGRSVTAHSFVEGLSVDDRNGHGTFSAGVACGPEEPFGAPRYGIACGADLYVAKVLDDHATGTDGDVLAGIDWAVRNCCDVVCMSLGSPVLPGDSYPFAYEEAAARALAAGTVLIAPAGNGSQRPDRIAPVERPANCPSILAAGAIDRDLTLASFSNGGLDREGGEVDLVAPGVGIVAAAPRPTLRQVGSGTSVAAPFVAGIAALLAEAHPSARGLGLRTLLLGTCAALPPPARDVGAGLAQAPRGSLP